MDRIHSSYNFDPPLIEGVIKSRPNRFIMLVKLGKNIVKAHCPVTGRIGDLVFKNIPCLVSKSQPNTDRKTGYTVEAISLDPIRKKNKRWIGINQTRINKYVEFFFRQGQLLRIANGKNISREIKINNSRIDFLIDNALIEIKMPLITLPSSEGMAKKISSKFNSFDRMIKHFLILSKSLKTPKSKAVLINCYMYDAPPFSPPKTDKTNSRIKKAAEQAISNGVEFWQINLKIDKKKVTLFRYFKLNLFN